MRAALLLIALSLRPFGSEAQVVRPFSPKDVRLTDSRFRDNFKRDSAWMMSIPVASLLHSFRNTSGTFSAPEGGYDAVRKLGGWESLDCDLRGHITGHLMSALALLYAQTGSETVRMKADSIVRGLGEVQQTYGNGYLSAFAEGLIDRNIRGESVWAPWYTLHKILQGLLDQYALCGNDSALAVARRMGEWAYSKTSALSEDTCRLMLRNEFGGFNEAMYNLYAITEDERFLRTARFFYHDDKINPLKLLAGNVSGDTRPIPDLGTDHANTLIPKLLGEARNYELFGDTLSRRVAELLFETLTVDHAFVTGEVSDKEHLFNPAAQSQHLTGYDGENCCTYNLLKLGSHVFSWQPKAEVADYMERALWNHVLGQQDPETSMLTYFTPLETGAYRLYSTRDSSYWCCVGSGFENHVKYAEYIYYHGEADLYANLLIPSIVDWDGTTITQETDFPASGTTNYIIGGRRRQFTFHIRKPCWATSMVVTLNGERCGLEGTGYVSITRTWESGDRLEVSYGMSLREEATNDDPARVAILYGPIVLAGELGVAENPFSDPRLHNDYYTKDYGIPRGLDSKAAYTSLHDFVRTAPLEWRLPNGVVVRPFYDVHHRRYVVYWHLRTCDRR